MAAPKRLLETKADRRERRQRNARKMKVSGRSVLLLDELQRRKAQELEKRDAPTD